MGLKFEFHNFEIEPSTFMKNLGIILQSKGFRKYIRYDARKTNEICSTFRLRRNIGGSKSSKRRVLYREPRGRAA